MERVRILWTIALGACACALWVSGCRGRAEFRRGEELLDQGDLRGAYVAFHDAWRLSPSDAHRGALRSVGAELGARLRAEAELAKRDLDFEAAIDAYAVALEYEPRHPAAIRGYAEAWGEVERWWQEHEESALGEAAAAWRGFARSFRAACAPACPATFRRELVKAGLDGLRRDLARLRAEAEAAGEGLEVRDIEARTEDLEAFIQRCSEWRAAQDGAESAPLGLDAASLWLHREVGAACGLPAALAALEAEAVLAREALLERLAGARLFARGLEHESAGRLVEAREAYRKVKFFHPTSATEAEGAAERVGGRLVSSLREEAQLRAARREWEEARRCLERLLALAPDDRDAKLAHSECTREVQRAHRRAAEAFEARGLAGNALVSYLDAVEAAPEDSELRAAAGRVAGALRSEIVFAPRLEVDSVESETGLEGQFWALSGGGAAAALRGLRRGFDEALDAPPLESGAARGARPGRVFVEALDLTVEPTTATCGVVTDRFAGALVLSENPRRQRAAVELTATEQVREGARSRWEAAPDYAKGFVGDELELASLRVEQAELLLAAEPASVPVCQWEGGSYEVHDVVVSTRLWAYVRIDGEAAGQWVSVSRQESDRVVASSGNAQVAADPLEVASRERLLDSLAVGLGRRVREEARRSFDEGLARHYRRGLERLRAGSRESAVEHFVRFLVSEAPAPSTTPPAEREDALHRLEGLTQSGSLRRWLDLSSGR